MLARVEGRLFGESTLGPQHIAHYRVIERLGSGGMGVVYSGFDPKLERKVALKLLKPDRVTELGRERLLSEARVLARLSHPNVVQVHDVDEYEGKVHLAMELVEGENLGRWQRRGHGVRALLEVYRQAGAGLAAAHEAGIVHRDFKPANVLLSHTGAVKVADFGLAHPHGDEVPETEVTGGGEGSTQPIVGTRGYLAPELWRGGVADARSDQFAFCVSLWEAVAGEPPFVREQTPAGMPAGKWRGSRWLRRVLLRGLRIDPAARWESMHALLRALEFVPRRRRWALGSALVVGLALPLVVWSARLDPSPVCSSESRPELWGASTLSALEGRWSIIDEPGTGESIEALRGELEAREQHWRTAWSELCGVDEDGARVSAQGCLGRARTRALVIRDALSAVDSLAQAEGLIDELEDPRACVELGALGAQARGVHAIFAAWSNEAELAAVRVAIVRGEFTWARDQAQMLAALGGPGATQAWLLLGRLLSESGDRGGAREALLEANRRATVARSPRVALEAQLALSRLAAREFDNALDARSWHSQAETTWGLLGQPASEGLELRHTEAIVLALEGELEAARAILAGLVDELVARAEGPRRVEQARLGLANVSASLGQHEHAMRIYAEILRAREQRLSPEHPALGVVAFDIADSLVLLERWEEARPLLERALAIEIRAYTSHSLRAAQVQIRLAEVETERGEHARAVRLASAAWATQQRELERDDEEYGSALGVLAWAHLQAKRWDAAYIDHRTLLEQMALDDEDLAATHQTLAWIACRRQPPCADAEPHIARVRELAEPGSLTIVRADAVAAEVALVAGEWGAASTRARAVLSELAALPAETDLELEAEAQAILGLGLLGQGERGLAHEHLMNALELKAYLIDDLDMRIERALDAEF